MTAFIVIYLLIGLFVAGAVFEVMSGTSEQLFCIVVCLLIWPFILGGGIARALEDSEITIGKPVEAKDEK